MKLMTLAATIGVLLPSLASAAPVDFTAPLHGLDGKPAQECKEATSDGKGCAKSGPITLGEISALALSKPDQQASLVDQVRRGRLAQKVLDGKAVSLTSEEVTLIKDALPKLGLSTVLVADVVEKLDPAAVK